MSLEMRTDGVEIRWISDNWASVAARRDFSRGEVIERCPLVVLNQRESHFIEATDLLCLCVRNKKKLVLPGGYGSVYLPSEDPNASFEIFPKERVMVVSADRKIKSGEFVHFDRGVINQTNIKYGWSEPSPYHSNGLVVKSSPKGGLGTFTTKKFKKNEIAELCYLYLLTEKESHFVTETAVNNFMYARGSKDQLSGWAVGYPCFYNHSKEPNVDPFNEIKHVKYDHLAVKILEDLEPDTELLFDYGWEEKDLGFKVK